jgi:hypothetical protein
VGSTSATAPINVASFRAVPPRMSQTLSDGVQTGQNTRWPLVAEVTARNLRPQFPNWYNNLGAEIDGPNAITVRAALESSDAQFIPLFFKGARDVVIQPGATVTADDSGFDVVKGEVFYVTVTSGQKWPHMSPQWYTGEGQTIGTSTTDLTTTAGQMLSASLSKAYGPSSVLGTLRGLSCPSSARLPTPSGPGPAKR